MNHPPCTKPIPPASSPPSSHSFPCFPFLFPPAPSPQRFVSISFLLHLASPSPSPPPPSSQLPPIAFSPRKLPPPSPSSSLLLPPRSSPQRDSFPVVTFHNFYFRYFAPWSLPPPPTLHAAFIPVPPYTLLPLPFSTETTKSVTVGVPF